MSRLPGDPGPGRQVLFALGARLPDRNREWVRHELTDADWRGRLIVRHLIVTLPFTATLALLPGALWIRIAVPALFLICSVGVVALYADDIRVSRLRRHGIKAPDDPDLGRPSHLAAPGPVWPAAPPCPPAPARSPTSPPPSRNQPANPPAGP